MFRFPWGDMHSLNLGWFLQKFNELREDWATAEAGIDGALDSEIQKAEDALSDVFDARDAAAASATAAAGSASAAGTSATAAQNSATAAASSATLANQKATAAGLSEAAAAQSATAASNSASAAATSATQAGNSAAAAQSSAAAAAASEQHVEEIIEDAIASATQTATTAATNAANSATAAAGSATAAAGSATAAAGSATAAAGSAEDAESAAAAIEESAAQITQNTADIANLKTDTVFIQEPIITPFLTKKFSTEANGRTVSVNNNVFTSSGTGFGSNYTAIFLGERALAIASANSTNIRAFLENHLADLVPITTQSALLLSMFLKSGNGSGKMIGIYACTDTAFIGGQIINLNTVNINHLLYTMPDNATKFCVILIDQTPANASEIVFNVEPFPNINAMMATMLENS